ncbi:MAG: hypothetical protein ACT4OK_10860 [Gemmobacter sp.]
MPAAAKHHRVGLWVLSTFAVIAALMAISAVVIGPQNADLKLILPLAMFWSVTVCVGFLIRAALVNVVRSVSRRITGKPAETVEDEATPYKVRHVAEKPDAALERLERMVQRERNREALYPHLARGLVHAA